MSTAPVYDEDEEEIGAVDLGTPAPGDDEPLALPDQDPALALAPGDGGRSPTGALALEDDDQAVDAVTGLPGDIPGARPPAPGGDLTTGQLAAAATAAPEQVLDPVDQVLADNPVPPRPPPPGKPGSVQSQEQEALAEGRALVDDAVAAERKASDARQKVATAAQQQADEQVRLATEHAARQKAITDAANQRTQQWMDRAKEESDRYSKMGIQDYWSKQPVWAKVLSGLAQATGAAAQAQGGGPNGAAAMLKDTIERDFRQQQFAIGKQKEAVDMARQGVNDSLTQKQRDLADNNLMKAAAYDAVAAKYVSMKLQQGVPLEQAQTDANVVKLRQQANRTRMETLQAIHRQNIADAHLRIDQQRADQAGRLADARARKLKGGGAGGGGRGGGDAFEAMQKAAESEGANLASVIQAGMPGLGRKEAAKQGKIIWDEYQKGGKASAKAAAGEIEGIDKEFKPFREQAVGTARTMGPVRTLSQVEAVREGLEEAIASGDKGRLKAAVVKSMEQAGTLMSGGKLTNAQIKILHELESSQDEMTQKIGKWTGNPTAGKGLVTRLMHLIEDAGTEYAKQIGDIRQRGIDQFLAEGGSANTPDKKQRLLNLNRGLYGQVKWKGKHLFNEPGATQGEGGEAPAAGGGGGKAAKAKAIVSNPANKAKYTDQEWARLVQMSEGR